MASIKANNPNANPIIDNVFLLFFLNNPITPRTSATELKIQVYTIVVNNAVTPKTNAKSP